MSAYTNLKCYYLRTQYLFPFIILNSSIFYYYFYQQDPVEYTEPFYQYFLLLLLPTGPSGIYAAFLGAGGFAF